MFRVLHQVLYLLEHRVGLVPLRRVLDSPFEGWAAAVQGWAARLEAEAGRIRRSITKTTSPSSVQSKRRQIEGKQKVAMASRKKAADIEGKAAAVVSDLAMDDGSPGEGSDYLVRVLRGEYPGREIGPIHLRVAMYADEEANRALERAVADRLGADPAVVGETARRRWGRGLLEERERRLHERLRGLELIERGSQSATVLGR